MVFPDLDGPPTCLDTTTSSIPWNGVMNVCREGHSLADGAAIESDDGVTRDVQHAAPLLSLRGSDVDYKD